MATSQKKNLLKKGFMFETNTSHSIEIGRVFYSHLKDKKKSLNNLHTQLSNDEYPVSYIHGELSSNERKEENMQKQYVSP